MGHGGTRDRLNVLPRQRGETDHINQDIVCNPLLYYNTRQVIKLKLIFFSKEINVLILLRLGFLHFLISPI